MNMENRKQETKTKQEKIAHEIRKLYFDVMNSAKGISDVIDHLYPSEFTISEKIEIAKNVIDEGSDIGGVIFKKIKDKMNWDN